MEKQHGMICAYIGTKGFGFISQGEGKTFRKFFFHIKSYKSGAPETGMRVSFDVSPITEGPRPTALNVEPEAI